MKNKTVIVTYEIDGRYNNQGGKDPINKVF